MAAALARGWGDPVLATDSGSGQAAALARSSAARRWPPTPRSPQLRRRRARPQARAARGRRRRGAGGRRGGRLAARPHDDRAAAGRLPRHAGGARAAQHARPRSPRRDAAGRARRRAAGRPRSRSCSARVGAVVRVPEGIIDACAACSGVGPAYWALVAEAWVEAAIRRGIPAPIAQRLVTETMAGSAELLRAREHDTLRLRREVTSPGGTTARGLAALERGGCGRRSPPRWTTSSGWHDPQRHRRLPRGADPRLHDLHRGLGRALARLLARRAHALQPRRSTGSWTSCATSRSPFLRLFRELPLQIGPLDLSPMVAIIVLQIGGGIVVGLIARLLISREVRPAGRGAGRGGRRRRPGHQVARARTTSSSAAATASSPASSSSTSATAGSRSGCSSTAACCS